MVLWNLRQMREVEPTMEAMRSELEMLRRKTVMVNIDPKEYVERAEAQIAELHRELADCKRERDQYRDRLDGIYKAWGI